MIHSTPPGFRAAPSVWLLLLVIIFSCAVAGSSQAQTIESVLRGLQARETMLEERGKLPGGGVFAGQYRAISWPDLSEKSPKDGDIHSLETAIRCLNHASRVFDDIKQYYVQVDPSTGAVIRNPSEPSGNGSVSYSNLQTIQLPSVGVFDESNWREKLVQLASNVDQLQCLLWPLKDSQYYAWAPANNESVFSPQHSLQTSYTFNLLDFFAVDTYTWEPDGTIGTIGPYTLADIGNSPYLYYQRANGFWYRDIPYYRKKDCNWFLPITPTVTTVNNGGAGFIFELSGTIRSGSEDEIHYYRGSRDIPGTYIRAWGSQIASVGVQTTIPERGKNGTSKTDTPKMWLYKVPVRGGSPNADLIEQYLKQYDVAGKLEWSNAIPIPMIMGTNSFALGEPAATPTTFNAAAEKFFAMLGLPSPSFATELDDGTYGTILGAISVTPHDTNNYTPVDPVTNRPNRFALNIKCFAIFAPAFEKCLEPGNKALTAAMLRHGIGEIEMTITKRELFRIHVGRGKNDGNQQGWIGATDNFGSLVFHGSAAEFELEYTKDSTSHPDQPQGGKWADVPKSYELEFPTKGWESRWQLLDRWHEPRLTSVKGGDVMAKIIYKANGNREVELRWLKGGQGIKKITIANPRPASNPVSIEKRNFEITEAELKDSAPADGKTRNYTIEESLTGLANGATYYCHFGGPSGTKSDVTVRSDGKYYTEYYDGLLSNCLLEEYDGTLEPRWSETPKLLKMTMGWHNERIISLDWHSSDPDDKDFPGSGGRVPLKSVKFSVSGDYKWDQDKREIGYKDTGLLDYSSELLAGKTLKTKYTWSGNKRSATTSLATTSLDGADFRKSDETHVSPFSEVTYSIEGLESVVKYFPASGTDGPAWHMKSMQAPAAPDYRTEWLFDSANPRKRVVKTGWGTSFSSGQVTTKTMDLLGGFASGSVSLDGGATNVLSAVGSDFTPWDAPRNIAYSRGATSLGNQTLEYYESGFAWGTVKKTTDPYNVSQSLKDYDLLGRPISVDTGVDTLTFSYSDSSVEFHGVASSGSSTVSELGDITAATGSIGSRSSGMTWKSEGGGTMKVDGREVAFSGTADGAVKEIANGAGSRGSKMEVGVTDWTGTMPYGISPPFPKLFYTKTTEKKKEGGESTNVVQQYYDSFGRVVLSQYPDAKGKTAIDGYTYTDNGRTVTHFSGVGPTGYHTKVTVSAEGNVQTTQRRPVIDPDTAPFSDYLKKTRKVTGAKVEVLTQIFDDSDDSEGGTDGRRELSKEVVDGANGQTTFTPWGIAANAISVTEPTPGTPSRKVSQGADSITTTFQKGLPTGIEGKAGGIPITLAVETKNGLLTKVDGTVGGLKSGLKIENDLRISEAWSPGSHPKFSYSTAGGGFSVGMSDTAQGTTGRIAEDSVGDVTSVATPGALPLTLETNDVTDGRATKINGSVTMTAGHDGGVSHKAYTGGMDDRVTLNPDGSVAGFSSSSGSGSTSATVVQTPTSRTTAYSDGRTVAEEFYTAGPRKKVTVAGEDGRTFKYKRLEMTRETHTAGPWVGWTVEFVPDEARGRLQAVKVTGHGVSKEFQFSYDTYSRLKTSTATGGITAAYGERNAAGQLTSLSRGGADTVWSYHPGDSHADSGLLSGVTNTVPGHGNYDYTYATYDSRRRHKTRQASQGESWSGLGYDGQDQLLTASLGSGKVLRYGYDAAGNRTAGPQAAQAANGLNQITGRTLASRGFGIAGTVDPGSTVKVKIAPWDRWRPASVGPEGGFSGSWDLGAAEGSAMVLPVQVRASRPGLGAGGVPATSEKDIEVFIPPTREVFVYDSAAGRLKEDAFWKYTWDAAGRLVGMERKVGSAETLAFGYDADGRRTSKTHTFTGTVQGQSGTITESSRVLYAGWLAIMEERTRTAGGVATALPRRWFQWGVDLSGTLDGAGGIGGLVAIIEENASGVVTRTLLPMHDGLGNVTAVVNGADGSTVARYDYGPFGEPLGESGEVEACPFRWQTKWYDAECQHYYFGYRHYDPRLGRWLSRDPLGEAGGFNLYAYCGSDPVNRIDPWGLADRNAWLLSSDSYAWGLKNDPGFFANVGNFVGATWFGFFGSFRQAGTDMFDVARNDIPSSIANAKANLAAREASGQQDHYFALIERLAISSMEITTSPLTLPTNLDRIVTGIPKLPGVIASDFRTFASNPGASTGVTVLEDLGMVWFAGNTATKLPRLARSRWPGSRMPWNNAFPANEGWVAQEMQQQMQSAVNGRFFRGGEGLEAKLFTDVNPAVDGLIHPLGKNGRPQGLSINIDPKEYWVQKKGGAFPVTSIPEGLQVLPDGRPGHYVIAPSTPMTFKMFQQLLHKIILGNYNLIR